MLLLNTWHILQQTCVHKRHRADWGTTKRLVNCRENDFAHTGRGTGVVMGFGIRKVGNGLIDSEGTHTGTRSAITVTLITTARVFNCRN